MNSTHKCLKEWNATIESLGQGKQSILIRHYITKLDSFLLYPTVSYASKDNFLDSFKPEYESFIKGNTLPIIEKNKIAIKYFAKVEKIIEKSPSRIGSLNKNYIWTTEHVKNYLKGKKAYIWLLRIYELEKPYMADPTPGAIKYANLKEEVSLENIKPVLNDKEFEKVLQNIK